jgi:hypothetical protein
MKYCTRACLHLRAFDEVQYGGQRSGVEPNHVPPLPDAALGARAQGVENLLKVLHIFCVGAHGAARTDEAEIVFSSLFW